MPCARAAFTSLRASGRFSVTSRPCPRRPGRTGSSLIAPGSLPQAAGLRRDRLARVHLCDQQVHDLLQLFAEVCIAKAPVLVEALVRMPEGELAVHHAGPGRTEHLAQLGL